MAMVDPPETDRKRKRPIRNSEAVTGKRIETMVNRQIPNDVLFGEILTRLPAKSLMRFNCVSEQWQWHSTDHHYHHARSCSRPGVIVYSSKDKNEDGRFFYAPHSSNLLSLQLTVNPNLRSTQVVNGLVCFYSLNSELIYLCNVSTHEIINLPPPPPVTTYSRIPPSFSLGFDQINRVYKLLKLVRIPNQYWFNKFNILTIDKDNKYGWKEIVLPKYLAFGMNYGFLSNVCINSAFYWNWSRELIIFHLDTEKFEAIPYPDSLISYIRSELDVADLVGLYFPSELEVPDGVGVAEIGGRLALTHYVVGEKFFLWMLDDEQRIWDKHITIHLPFYLRETRLKIIGEPRLIIVGTPPGTSNEILFIKPRIISMASKRFLMHAYSYDLTKEKWKVVVEESGFSSSSFQASFVDCTTIICYHHVENMMPLKDILAIKQGVL